MPREPEDRDLSTRLAVIEQRLDEIIERLDVLGAELHRAAEEVESGACDGF